MTNVYRLLLIPFWGAVVLAFLGVTITFVPGGEYRWFEAVAALAAFGLLIPKAKYRIAAVLLLAFAAYAAYEGHQRGIQYREWLLKRAAAKQSE